MISDALQIDNYTEDDYKFYKKWCRDRRGQENRPKKIAYMFALFKLRKNGHIQCIVSGEFGQGKSSTAFITAKWETRFIKKMIRVWQSDPIRYKCPERLKAINTEDISFGVENEVIISPLDPASKYMGKCKILHSYVIDDALLFTSTQEANTKQTKRIRKNIAKNRKRNPSMYWCFPNIFKIPGVILELMDEAMHKEKQKVADLIIPSRAIQIKEKFDKERWERYAKHPKHFHTLITRHPSFMTKARYPGIKEDSKFWQEYLKKYDAYAYDEDDDKIKESSKTKMFNDLEKITGKLLTSITSATEREAKIKEILYNVLSEKMKSKPQAEQLAQSLSGQFIKWQEEKYVGKLATELSGSMLKNLGLEIDIDDDQENN